MYNAEDLVEQQNVPAPTAVKLDVEGAEYLVLSGMEALLSSPDCRFLFIEVHPKDLPNFGHSVEDVNNLLEKIGFSITNKITRGTE
ncbi:MAG: FkbM family methyltransferase [Gammaproteobacteria bacterium]|nr:FkbM family methyltransferase [Gammaproteobacteria bacterium]